MQSSGKQITDEDKVCKLLGAVNDHYAQIVSVIEATMDENTKVDFIYVKLLAEEHRLISSGTFKSRDLALNVNYQKGKTNKKVKSKRDKKDVVCYNCDKKGHYARDCKLKKKDSNESNGVASVAFLSIEGNNESITTQWILDSGATHHMTNVDLLELKEQDTTKVICADGKILTAKCKGLINADLNGLSVKIQNVLYFPDFKANLLSISKLSASGIDVSFKNGECTGTKNGKLIFTAIKSGNLYSLQLKSSLKVAANVADQKSETLMEWHEKLAHRDLNAVRKLLKDSNVEFIDSTEICESCLKGKQTKTPLAKDASKKDKPLEMVSTDVWGRARTQSLGGSVYYSTFIDHCSRAVFVYFLKTKDETCHALKEYLADIGSTSFKVLKLLSDILEKNLSLVALCITMVGNN